MSLARQQVLLVEDDESIRECLKQLLELEGFRVFTASNGKEGLERLRQMTLPSLILLDLYMPVMTGNEFVAALIKEDADVLSRIPIMVITASPLEGEAARTLQPFIKAAIQKPIDSDAFLAIIRRHLAGKPKTVSPHS